MRALNLPCSALLWDPLRIGIGQFPLDFSDRGIVGAVGITNSKLL